MPDPVRRADDLTPEQLKNAQDACLLLATYLGGYQDDLVLVGGLVPSLLIDARRMHDQLAGLHPGSADLDIALSLGLLRDERYHGLSDGLRRAGFVPDKNADGNPTPQRWRREGLTIDFLISMLDEDARAGSVQHLERDFAAYLIPGVHLAFSDREQVTIERTVEGERIRRSIWVCGPAAYLVLKAIAFDERGYEEDAYDLHYVLSRFEDGIEGVARRFMLLKNDSLSQRALDVLRRDFMAIDSIGPVRAARFITDPADDDLKADVAGAVRRFLALVEQAGG